MKDSHERPFSLHLAFKCKIFIFQRQKSKFFVFPRTGKGVLEKPLPFKGKNVSPFKMTFKH